MTHTEYTALLKQLPKTIKETYGLNEPSDLSKERKIRTENYQYYPDIPCMIVDDITVFWDKERPYIKPQIPEHLAAIKERIHGKRYESIGIIHTVKHDNENKIYCMLVSKNTDVSGLQAIAFDNTMIYYDNNEVDMQNDLTKTLAKVLFAAQRYETEYIVPSKDKNPANWE